MGVATTFMEIQSSFLEDLRAFDAQLHNSSCGVRRLIVEHASLCKMDPYPIASDSGAASPILSGRGENAMTESFIGEDVEAAIQHARSLLNACLILDHSKADMDHGSYEQWIDAITDSALTSWGEDKPILYHIKHLEESSCDHVQWILLKWCAKDHDCVECRDYDDPVDFISKMLEHKFNIDSPEYIFCFISQRICDEPLATPLNLCIGNYAEEQCDG